MAEVFLYSLIAIVILSLVALAHKYHIDTRSTIDELSKDRKLYQRMAWQEIEAREKFVKSQTSALAEHEAMIRHLVEQSGYAKLAVDSLWPKEDLSKKDVLERFEFLSVYEDMISKKDSKPLRKGSPPGVERRF
jgi:hypothetical protein